jgi:hypothetical protein
VAGRLALTTRQEESREGEGKDDNQHPPTAGQKQASKRKRKACESCKLTQKNAAQVPLTPETFITALNVPHRKSNLSVSSSATDTIPSTISLLTTSSNPASPSPPFSTTRTFSTSNISPYIPLARSRLTLNACRAQPINFPGAQTSSSSLLCWWW